MKYQHVDAKILGYRLIVRCRGKYCSFHFDQEIEPHDQHALLKIRKQIRSHVKESGHRVSGAFTDIVDYTRTEGLGEDEDTIVPGDSNLHGAGMRLAMGAGDSEEMEIRNRRMRPRRK